MDSFILVHSHNGNTMLAEAFSSFPAENTTTVNSLLTDTRYNPYFLKGHRFFYFPSWFAGILSKPVLLDGLTRRSQNQETNVEVSPDTSGC